MDNIERAGPDMSGIERDTFGDVLEFRIRIKSQSHVGVDFFKTTIENVLESPMFDIIFIKENKNLNRET